MPAYHVELRRTRIITEVACITVHAKNRTGAIYEANQRKEDIGDDLWDVDTYDFEYEVVTKQDVEKRS